MSGSIENDYGPWMLPEKIIGICIACGKQKTAAQVNNVYSDGDIDECLDFEENELIVDEADSLNLHIVMCQRCSEERTRILDDLFGGNE